MVNAISATSIAQVYDREDFRDGLKEMRRACFFNFDISSVIRINKVLRRPDYFEQVFEESLEVAAVTLDKSFGGQEFGDGELIKWFLDWLENGGWELILKIIKDIIEVIG